RFTQRICNRHTGVGADGVEWLFPSSDADIDARLVTAEWPEEESDWNGPRSVAAYVNDYNKDSIAVKTGAGIKTCTLTARKGNAFEFEIAMGVPEFIAELTIPPSFGDV